MKTPKNFKCKRCGSCCLISPFLNSKEIKRIVDKGYKQEEFVEELRGKKFMKNKKGRCVFLKYNGKKTECIIHSVRPDTCRQYPSELKEDGDCRPVVLEFDKR